MSNKEQIIAALIELDDENSVRSFHDTKQPLFHKLIATCNGNYTVLIDHLRSDVDPRDAGRHPRGCWWTIIALSCLTGENPIKPGHEGRLDAIIADWLEWADARGL